MNKLDDVTDDETLEKPILKGLQDPEQDGPQDKGNTVYYAFLFMGFCALLPWSCILNCFDFMAAYVKLPFHLSLKLFSCRWETTHQPLLIRSRTTLLSLHRKCGC